MRLKGYKAPKIRINLMVRGFNWGVRPLFIYAFFLVICWGAVCSGAALFKLKKINMNLGSRKNVGLLALGALLMQETNQGKNFTHSYYNKPRTSQGGGRTKKQKNRKRAANKSKRANRKK